MGLVLASCAKEDKKQNPTVVSVPVPTGPPGCLAVDTDGDGVINCEDPDMDNDGILNEDDAFPLDRLEWLDSDGDRVGDNSDWAPLDPQESNDADDDGVGDNADADDDNDGVPDLFEYINLELNPTEWFDTDLDGLGDTVEDFDTDNDGVPNIFDDLFWNKFAFFDIDNDIIGNNQDDDIDGDNKLNIVDAFPFDSTEWVDTDLDRLGNNIDPDDDNDGFPDDWEDYPLDRNYLYDTDGDGYANIVDAFPFDPNDWVDTDGDGVGDNTDPFPTNPNESADTDGDGIGDNSDQDIDNDGFINCLPVTSTNPQCNQDAFPYDLFEWLDSDGDGIGNNTDADDDNDGTPDVFDKLPIDGLHDQDFDEDGIPDSTFPQTEGELNFLLSEGKVYFIYDPDVDNDGVPNVFDDLPWNRFEFADIDGDFIGNREDLDDDGDGVPDNIDLFPFNDEEFGDFDGDGIGNNTDADDDNDGVPDLFDTLANNRNGYSDLDGNGIPDQIELDIDGDGRVNNELSCVGSIGVQIVCSYPLSQDLFIWDATEWEDLDNDTLGDNGDPDDDNDGVPDQWDDFKYQPLNFYDIDGDGVPNRTDEDIDGDGVVAPGLVCSVSGADIVCSHERQRCESVTTIDEFGVESTAIVCEEYDHFPYNNNYQSDLDNDRIPDNIDDDIDGDGKINCVPLGDPQSTDACNQDAVPFAGPNHPFVEKKFSEFEEVPPGSGNFVLRESDYCFDKAAGPPELRTCWYTYSDRDNDGLSDFEEYNLSTDPEVADTDGDGVPDPVEVAQGTLPTDDEDFLDSDGDLTPDYSDPTPRGVFSEASLRQQVLNSGNCSNFDRESNCQDFDTELCYWEPSDPPVLIPDPENPGDQINSGLCRAKEMILTENIQMNDCLQVLGEVNLVGKSGGDRFAIEFPQTSSGGINCSPANFAFITMDQDSNVSLKDIDIKGELAPRLIYSQGDSLSLDNVSLIGKDINSMTLVEFENSSNGRLDIKKSTLRTGAIEGSGNEPNLLSLLNGLEVLSDDLKISGSIIECNLNTRIPNSPDYNCVNTDANTAVFEGNVIANLDFVHDTAGGYSNTYAHRHQSGVQVSYDNSRVYSSTKALNLTGQSISVSSSTRVSNGDESGTYLENSVQNLVASPPDLIDINKLFATPTSNNLACVKQSSADLATVHGAYFSAQNPQSYWNFASVSIIGQGSTNLTPEGDLSSASDFAFWDNPLGTSGEDLGDPLFGNSGDYSSVNGYVTLEDDTTDSGIGRNFSGLDLSKSYRLSFDALEADIGKSQDIVLEVIVRESNTGNPIRVVNVSYGNGEDVINNGGISILRQMIFGQEKFVLNFLINQPNISVTIAVNFNPNAERVIIDNIELLQSSDLTFQYPGVDVGICE